MIGAHFIEISVRVERVVHRTKGEKEKESPEANGGTMG
jgi:hypothetical protein